MNISLNPSVWGGGGITAVPSVIIDRHLRICGSLALKVILLILRDQETYRDEKAIGEKLKCDMSDLSDALNYWEEAGIIVLGENKEFKDIDTAAIKKEEISSKTEETQKDKTFSTKRSEDRPFLLTREEVAAMIKNDKTLNQLVLEAQEILGKTLNSHDLDILVALYDCHNLTAHFMVMLLNFCASQNKKTMPYVKKVAEDWISKGIDDNNVDAHVDKMTYLFSAEGRIKTALGIERKLIKSEREYIEKWVTVYNMDVDIIVFAYEKCIEAINKINFKYMDKVLASWYQNKALTREDAESLTDQKDRKLKASGEETDFMKLLEKNYDKE